MKISKQKKGMESKTLGIVMAVIIFGALVLFFFYGVYPKITGGTKQIFFLSPGADEICRIKSLTGNIVDIDNDKRDDSCDWCVCEKGCNNIAIADDKDGDKLPDKCDANPNDSSIVAFNENNCKEDINLNVKKTQCRPS